MKFRVLDVKNNKLIYNLYINSNGCIINSNNNKILPQENYKIQRYTGCNDLNNVEIYEGDTLKVNIPTFYKKFITQNFKVIFHDHKWSLINDENQTDNFNLTKNSLIIKNNLI